MKQSCSILKFRTSSVSAHSQNIFGLLPFLIILLIIFVKESASTNFSFPPMQKCEINRLSDQEKELVLPSHISSSEDPIHFRIIEKCATRLPHCMRPCPSPMTQLSISLLPPQPHSHSPLKPQDNVTNEEQYHDDDGVVHYHTGSFSIPHHFTPRGYFLYDDEYFSPDDFCLYSHQEEQLIIKICPSKCAGASANEHYNDIGSRTIASSSEDDIQNDDQDDSLSLSSTEPDSFQVCVPKCCSIHKVLDLQTFSCEETHSAIPWAPLVYRSASRQICGEKRTSLKLHYIQTQPPCQNFVKYFLRAMPVPGTTRVRFRLLTNGTVVLRELGKLAWTVLEQGTYCMDGVQGYGSQPKVYTGDPLDQVLLLCLLGGEEQEQLPEHGDAHGNSSMENNSSDRTPTDLEPEWDASKEDRLEFTGIAYVILLFSGIPFLLITAIVYVLVWNKQNVHGWTQFSHTLAILLHYLAQALANTVSRIFNSDQNASSICRIVGISNHYFVLASFCWLTVINYDLFSMFRRLKTTVGRSRGLKRFLVYMTIAWGLPFIAVLISVILDRLYGLYGDDGDCEVDVIVPVYGHRTCYMAEDARPYYLFYPVGILMMLNMILAGMTFINMYKHDQSAKMVTDRSTKHRRKFSILAKLFVVMGLVWIFEMFVWLFIKEDETLPWYLVFPDVFNFLQAVAIFRLFACQPKILNQIEESYPKLKSITEILKRLSCKKNNNDSRKTQTNSSNMTSLPPSRTQSKSTPNTVNNNASNVNPSVNATDNGGIKLAVMVPDKNDH